MLGLCHFIFATFPHEKFFTVTANVTVTVVPLEFWILTEIGKNIFLKFFKFFFYYFFKTYIKAYILWVIFMIFKIFFLFFSIFYGFLRKKYPIFLKSMTKIAPFPQPNFAIWLWFLTIFRVSVPPVTSRKIAKSVIFCSSWPVQTVLSKFSWVGANKPDLFGAITFKRIVQMTWFFGSTPKIKIYDNLIF